MNILCGFPETAWRSLSGDRMDSPPTCKPFRERIAAACHPLRARPGRRHSAGREQKPAARSHLRAAAGAGLSLFGETACRKQSPRQSANAPAPCSWHMIGHLQTNKCRDAVSLFSMIQSVDSLPLAIEINKWAGHLPKPCPYCWRSTSPANPPSSAALPKNSWPPCPRSIPAPVGDSRPDDHRPVHPDPEKVRPVFRRLREWKAECEKILGAPLPHFEHGHDRRF